VEGIYLKKFASVIALMIIITSGILSLNHTLISVSKTDLYPVASYKPPAGSREELYQDIIVTLLEPHMSRAIKDYYGTSYGFDIWGTDIIEVERPNGNRTPIFIIKLQIAPYIGAHNTVGIDNLTFRVSVGNQGVLEKFEYIKSYPIPPWLQPH
jgi:hypothetical protein